MLRHRTSIITPLDNSGEQNPLTKYNIPGAKLHADARAIPCIIMMAKYQN